MREREGQGVQLPGSVASRNRACRDSICTPLDARLARAIGLTLLLLVWGCGSETEESELQREEQAQLEVLGYINAVPVERRFEGRAGVTLYDRERSQPGFNFFNARNESFARLMDMQGAEIHRWASDAKGRSYLQFERQLPGRMPPWLGGWNFVELLDDGGILAIGSHHLLLRLDRDSRVRWKLDIAAHHDLSVAPDGRIHVLVDVLRTARANGSLVAFQDNHILVVSAEGRIERSLSIFDALVAGDTRDRVGRSLGRVIANREARASGYREASLAGDPEDRKLERLYREAIEGNFDVGSGIKNVLFHNHVEDIFHTNSVQVVERDEPGLWRRGDLLVSILKFDMVAVLDQESGRVLWTWGTGALRRAHHATQLPDGGILIFDNGVGLDRSRIVKLDPRSERITWQFESDPPSAFYSASRGGAEMLPNGNVLIADTTSGRAFEVTRGGVVVWEYFSDPLKSGRLREGGTEPKRAAIYRMARFSSSEARRRLGDIIPLDADRAGR